jgi:hypothetical protein
VRGAAARAARAAPEASIATAFLRSRRDFESFKKALGQARLSKKEKMRLKEIQTKFSALGARRQPFLAQSLALFAFPAHLRERCSQGAVKMASPSPVGAAAFAISADEALAVAA